MKILYFYQYFSTPSGSWGTRAYEFARRWVQHGDEVIIVTGIYDKSDLSGGRCLVSRQNIDGIDVRVVNVNFSNKHGILKRIASFLVYLMIAIWYALTERSDVAIASSGPITTAVPCLVSKFLRRTPMVLEVRDLWPEVPEQMGAVSNRFLRTGTRWFVRLCYRASSRIVALSPGMRDSIVGLGYNRVDVVPNAADNHLFAAADPPSWRFPEWADETRLVVFTGTLGAANDCDQILAAADVLKHRGRDDITVALIGDGSQRARLSQAADERFLDNLHFLDPIPKVELAPWIRRADCVLLVLRPIPVFDTSSPNKLFDAFASGRPVIQTTQGWIKVLLEEFNCGISVPPRDAEAMADAIERVVDNPTLASQMGDNGRRLANTQFDRDYLASEMRIALARAAGHRRVDAEEAGVQA